MNSSVIRVPALICVTTEELGQDIVKTYKILIRIS